jgi:subtilase family serine protease
MVMNRFRARSHAPWRVLLLAGLAACLLAALLAACASAAFPHRGNTANATPTRPVHGPMLLGPTGPGRVIDISLLLAGQNQTALTETLAAIDDPSSPSYHHYLTPAEYAKRFGASPAVEAGVETVLRSAGLSVTGITANHLTLYARGPVGQMESLFHVHLKDYRGADGEPYYKPDSPPRIPASLGSLVTGVLGLDSMRLPNPRSVFGFTRAQAQAGGGMTPQDLAAAYNLTSLHQSGLDGSGQSIVLAEIDHIKQSDIDAYDRTYGISASPVSVVPVDGGSTSTSPEPVLDIEVIHAIAPKTHIIAYEVSSSSSSMQSIANMFAQIVTDNRAPVLSISLGTCEPSADRSWFSSIDRSFQQAAAQGMSVLSASGDNGAYDCGDQNLAVDSPTSDPYVTSVGGTSLFLNGNSSYNFEAGWEGPLAAVGGGGGVSQVFARPSWQTGAGVLNTYSNGARQVPDVSANADTLTGYRIYYSGPGGCTNHDCWQVVGGTSAAAPLWAALIVLANQARAANNKNSIGFLNPTLYKLAGGAGGASPFHDVIYGGNLFYPATPGWDYSTGLGTPDGATLVAELRKA